MVEIAKRGRSRAL